MEKKRQRAEGDHQVDINLPPRDPSERAHGDLSGMMDNRSGVRSIDTSVSEEGGGAPSRRTDWVFFKETLQVKSLSACCGWFLRRAIKMARKKKHNNNKADESDYRQLIMGSKHIFQCCQYSEISLNSSGGDSLTCFRAHEHSPAAPPGGSSLKHFPES